MAEVLREAEGEEPNSTERKSDLWNDGYMVEARRKQKRSNLQDQRKPGKRHRVSYSHDAEGHVYKSPSQSKSILEESHKSHKQVDDAYEIEGGRYTNNLDDDRIGHFKDYRHGSYKSSSSSRRQREKDRKPELVRERERDRDRDRDRGRERKREKALYGEEEYEMERERKERKREKALYGEEEYEMERERKERKREKALYGEEEYEMERERKERKREKALYGEEEYEMERERKERKRRNRYRETRERSREGDRGRSSRQRRSDDLEDYVHAYHRRKTHYEIEIERHSTADLLKAVETESEQPKRDEVELDGYLEKIAFQLAKQEEEEQEIVRIKEESRKRKQAILEKYKNQLSQMEQVTQSGDKAAVHVDQSTEKRAAGDTVVPEPMDGPTNGADVHVDEPIFSTAKSPLQVSSGAGEVGQGTPEFSKEELVKKLEEKIECLQRQQQEYDDRVKQQFSTEELVQELSKAIEYFKQLQQEHKDLAKQQFRIEELEKQLAKQIESLQQHHQEYKDQAKQSHRSADMFCDDIFVESPAGTREKGKGDGLPIERSSLHDNWDDPEGYYRYRFGEILNDRYEILAAHGKGVFSTVVRAKDLKARPGDPEEVAIKIIRNNETMYKAGMEELVVLKKLVAADPKDKHRCVRLISSFKYRNHLCLVFESLRMNLRSLQNKLGRNIGLSLSAVKCFAEQLFSALKHLKSCSVLHCDIKPDNILVNEARTAVKLCDFGNAMLAGKNEITPYLVSRFYRAPEIILGLPYDHPMDIWSVGCCLFELCAGRILFPGCSNNDMLRLHMELKGPFPKKMLRKGAFTYQHFNQDLNFLATEEDPVTKKALRKLIANFKPKDISSVISGDSHKELKMLARFKDLMERIFVLDPAKRITASQALKHPFIRMKCEQQ
ncbi:unnamed protein product [Withania somnifera]